MDRGHYKIFLGMAAGVGKTYRMLQEGHAEADAGRDVVIGYLEPHKRQETSDQARGLEVVPRRRVAYPRRRGRGDGPAGACSPARPELALIDELAHTNPPGLEHEKRYEDIADVLAAGIDVFSTVNVQHLESLNDQVAELTGVRVRETVPDSVLGTADEVVLIDLTPEALIARLRAGKIYPGENIEAALNNFFRIENLAALREVSLRQVAEDVESKRLVLQPRPSRVGTREEERVAADAPKAVGERLLALVRPQPSSQRLVRRAWRSAQRLGTDLDLLWVKPPGKPIEGEEERQVTALRQLASVLGATLLIEEHDDLVAAVARVVRERGTTYIMVGESQPAARPGAPARTAAAAADAGDPARGRRADRRPPRPQGGRAMIEHVLVGLALLLGLGGGYLIARSRLRGQRSERPEAVHQILLPFTGTEISRRAVDAALRLARAEDATLMPAYLAAVPKQPAAGVRDPERGGEGDADAGGDRTARHRPGRAGRRPDRARPLLPPRARAPARAARPSTASSSRRPPTGAAGFSGDDLVWLLREGPGRGADPAARPEDRRVVSASGAGVKANGTAPARAIGDARPSGRREAHPQRPRRLQHRRRARCG